MAKAREIPGIGPDLPFRESAARAVEVRTEELFSFSEGVLDTEDIERLHDMRDRPADEPEVHALRRLEANRLDGGRVEAVRVRVVCREDDVLSAGTRPGSRASSRSCGPARAGATSSWPTSSSASSPTGSS